MIAWLVVLAVMAASLLVAEPPPGEWPTYGGDLASSKYSPLTQIDGSNFSSLRVAWRAPSPDARLSVTLPGGGTKATGKELGSTDLPGAAIGTPMTYLMNGPQYIALTVQGTGGATAIPELVALALP